MVNRNKIKPEWLTISIYYFMFRKYRFCETVILVIFRIIFVMKPLI